MLLRRARWGEAVAQLSATLNSPEHRWLAGPAAGRPVAEEQRDCDSCCLLPRTLPAPGVVALILHASSYSVLTMTLKWEKQNSQKLSNRASPSLSGTSEPTQSSFKACVWLPCPPASGEADAPSGFHVRWVSTHKTTLSTCCLVLLIRKGRPLNQGVRELVSLLPRSLPLFGVLSRSAGGESLSPGGA